jgi:asparagine synthase (glutamine-hydrolysing)
MCGIFFYISVTEMRPDEYKHLLTGSDRRRGGDKTTAVMHPHFMMIFDRLSFHDLSPLGDQPFIFHDGSTTIYLMANAEIYNHRAITMRHGFKTRSDSDCEVIYHLLRRYDYDTAAVVRELDGEFAFVFVVVDGLGGAVVGAARDPFGVRPLFMGSSGDGSLAFASVAKSLLLMDTVTVFPPGHYYNKGGVVRSFYSYNITATVDMEMDFIYKKITDLLIDAVRKRLDGERPIACCLSGGLDSSLVCAIVRRVLGRADIETFTIGMEGSTDVECANTVKAHLGVERHHDVYITIEEALGAIDEVILACETYDMTTIRASVGQLLLARYIATKTACKTVLNGDGADEVEMGYLYWYSAPSVEAAHEETIRRLREIHLYDGLRVDRCLGYYGLEGRFPFLDTAFVEYYLSIPARLRVPTPERMEKFLIREAFDRLYPEILPASILWRKKEAFSDGISPVARSWYEIIGDRMESLVSDEEWRTVDLGFPQRAVSKESFYYQKKFAEYFTARHASILPRYWLPEWSGGTTEPSARTLRVYKTDT